MRRFSRLVVAGALVSFSTLAPAQVGQLSTPPTLDGDLSEWGIDALAVNTGGLVSSGTVGAQYRFRDAVSDDDGNGDYQYPDAWSTLPNNGPLAGFDPQTHDIERFYMAYDATNVYLAVKVNSTFFPYGMSRVAIYLDRSDVVTGTNTTQVGSHESDCQAPDIAFEPTFNWDYHVSNRGPAGSYFYRVDDNFSSYSGVVSEYDAPFNGVIEMAVPWSELGGYPGGAVNLRLFVGLGSEQDGNWRDPSDVPIETWKSSGGCFGGGSDNCSRPAVDGDYDSDVFDAIGSASSAQQEADLAAVCGTSLPEVTNSFVTIPLSLAPPPFMNALNERLYWSNDKVRFKFTLPATGATITNLANYTVVGDSPNNVTVTAVEFGTGDQADFVFLTLSRAITQAEIGSIQIQLSNAMVSNGGVPIAGGTTLDINEFQYIIPITVDARADDTMIGAPYVLGVWDGFSNRVNLTDGTDLLPGMPGSQIEAGDALGDGVWRGRLFTLVDPTLPIQDNFVVKSDYDFGTLLANPADNPRQLSVGYWHPYNYDPLYQFSGDYDNMDPIVVVKPAANRARLVSVPSVVTINLQVPNNFIYFDETAILNNEITMYVQAGPTFEDDNALPTTPSSDLPGNTAVNNGKVLTYLSSDPNFHYYTTTVTYPAGIPDITDLWFGYDYAGFGLFQEAEMPGDPMQPVITGVDSPIHKDRTIHRHLVRVTNSQNTGGRTITVTYDETNLDIALPTPESIGLTQGSPVYAQSFNTLPGSGPDIALPDNQELAALGQPGWYARRNSAPKNLLVQDAGDTADNVYSMGPIMGADRALGTISGANSDDQVFGVLIQNRSGANITQLVVNYRGEQWRRGDQGSPNNILRAIYRVFDPVSGPAPFSVIPDPSTDTPLTGFTPAPNLNFGPIGAGMPLNSFQDGNSVFADVLGVIDLNSTPILPGGTIFLAWQDYDDAGTDDGMAIDDLKIFAVYEGPATFADLEPIRTVTGNKLGALFAENGTLSPVTASVAPSPFPSGVTSFPLGLLSFNLGGIPNGSTQTVRMRFEPTTSADGYWKHDGSSYTDFFWNGTSGGQFDVGTQELQLTLVDGGFGDQDGTANGSITDPGGPSLGGPLLVDLVAFGAHAAFVGAPVSVVWETAAEYDTAGFHIDSAPAANGPWTRVTQGLIPAQGGVTSGASYSVVDPAPMVSGERWYRLEETELDGSTVTYGPVRGTVGDGASSVEAWMLY